LFQIKVFDFYYMPLEMTVRCSEVLQSSLGRQEPLSDCSDPEPFFDPRPLDGGVADSNMVIQEVSWEEDEGFSGQSDSSPRTQQEYKVCDEVLNMLAPKETPPEPKKKRKKNKKKKPTTPPKEAIECSEVDLTGDEIVAEFEQKLQKLDILMQSRAGTTKLKPNASEEWLAKITN
jgi:hypothetical protein